MSNLPTIQTSDNPRDYLKGFDRVLYDRGWKLRDIYFKKSKVKKQCLIEPLLKIRTINL